MSEVKKENDAGKEIVGRKKKKEAIVVEGTKGEW